MSIILGLWLETPDRAGAPASGRPTVLVNWGRRRLRDGFGRGFGGMSRGLKLGSAVLTVAKALVSNAAAINLFRYRDRTSSSGLNEPLQLDTETK